MRILLLACLALSGCAGLTTAQHDFSPATLIEAASKDPADIKLQAAYMGGTITYERTNPHPVATTCKQ